MPYTDDEMDVYSMCNGHLLQAGSVLGEHLELLLRSVLSKMQSATSLTVMQSLLVVFACLMQTELESVVTFLSQVPDPTGQPALNFVMKEWLTIHVCKRVLSVLSGYSALNAH